MSLRKYIIFSSTHTHNKCRITPQCADSCHASPHPFTPPTLPLHLSIKLTDISNTFHISLMTVTLPENCHTSPSPCSPPPWSSQLSIKWHTCLYFSHLTEDCHNTWQLSHLPSPLYISPMTIIPLHQQKQNSNNFHTSLRTVTPPDNCLIFPHSLTPPLWLWPSHLSINWHSCLIPFTPPWWLLHFLKPSDTPHALLLLPMTITPPHYPSNLLGTVTGTSWQLSHLPILPYLSLITITTLCQLTYTFRTFCWLSHFL